MGRQRETVEQRKLRAARIVRAMKKLYPSATTALRHDSALELLIATILSAQCTDERVNQVTPDLFKRYKTARDYAAASQAELEKQIQSTGFFRQKTKSIQAACLAIDEQFDGEVPDTMEQLLQLRGVARKTGNVMLGTWFGKNEGVCVDTHVGRLAERLGLTWTGRNSKDATRIEADLMQILPRRQWAFVSHALILHGRSVCTARKPKCEACKLAKDCPSTFTFK